MILAAPLGLCVPSGPILLLYAPQSGSGFIQRPASGVFRAASGSTKGMERLMRLHLLRHAMLLSVTLSMFDLSGQACAQSVPAGGPHALDGVIDGAAYSIRVPANWNGTLLVYARGYRTKSNRPDQPDDHRAFAAMSPREGFPQLPEMEELLLVNGYAIAGSAYRDNGFAVEEAIEDTRQLVRLFRRQVGRPSRTIIYGVSMGALVALHAAENPAGIYDGAICACGIVAGTPLVTDLTSDFAAAYAAVFGWPRSWGDIGDVRDDLDFDTEVLPLLISQLQNSANMPRFEFIRLVTQSPLAGFYDGTKPGPWLVLNMFFATEGRAELEGRAGGPVTQNRDHTYSLTATGRQYLVSLGLNPDPLVAQLELNFRFSADKKARRYSESFYEPGGRLRVPTLTIHTVGDGLATPANARVLRENLKQARDSSLLHQAYTNDTGHCSFTSAQFLQAIQAMERWVITGTQPRRDDFPAGLGFVPDFEPPAWPQPTRSRHRPGWLEAIPADHE